MTTRIPGITVVSISAIAIIDIRSSPTNDRPPGSITRDMSASIISTDLPGTATPSEAMTTVHLGTSSQGIKNGF